jgi:hypothetical protein
MFAQIAFLVDIFVPCWILEFTFHDRHRGKLTVPLLRRSRILRPFFSISRDRQNFCGSVQSKPLREGRPALQFEPVFNFRDCRDFLSPDDYHRFFCFTAATVRLRQKAHLLRTYADARFLAQPVTLPLCT